VNWDHEGHILVSPREVQTRAFENPRCLINDVLIPGTPLAIPHYEQHCRLLDYLAYELGVHPRDFLIKGSTKIGFSIAPDTSKVWMACGPESDLDLAIVDSHFFHLVDNQVGQWERHPDNRGIMFQDQRLLRAYRRRNNQKGFACFRFFDLPPIPILDNINNTLNNAPVAECCGIARGFSAFIFRDWWAVHARYDYDLSCLKRGLKAREHALPSAEDEPRPRAETPEGNEGPVEYADD
jgi:hypothetical protein